jgi:hypothetical protein
MCITSINQRGVMRGLHLILVLFLSIILMSKSGNSSHLKSFQWDPMQEIHNLTANSHRTRLNSSRPFASSLLQAQPLYISLTTIHNRIYGIMTTLRSLLNGTVWPDHIYIFVSRDPFLLDLGVTPEFIMSELKGKLDDIMDLYPWISIIFTENIGPHRKLLPLLAKKWREDCAIVTVDDHETYRETTLEILIKYYEASGRNAVVALRARRLGVCNDAPPWRVSPYTKNKKGLWPEASSGYNEMLLLPTGTGGVLYRPIFFHPIVFDRRLIKATKTGDDLLFRLATLTMGVPVVTACCEHDALGKRCPSKMPRIKQNNPKNISMFQFTFLKNYSADSLFGNLHSPGVHSGLNVITSETGQVSSNLKRHRVRKRPNGNSSLEGAVSTVSDMMRHVSRQRDLSISSNLRSNEAISRSLDEASVSWKDDPRRKESLAAKFNTRGGNNLMWEESLELLNKIEIIDFNSLLQQFVPAERTHCLLHSSVLSPEQTDEARGNMFDRVKIALQTSYSPECGICLCDSVNKN